MADFFWFPLKFDRRSLFDAVSDESLGAALKLALKYGATNEYTDPNTLPLDVRVIFNTLVNDIDDAHNAVQTKSDNGRIYVMRRKDRQ